MEEPIRRSSGQRAPVTYVCGNDVRNKRYSVKPTDPRPSGITESAAKTERQFKMLPVEVPCEQPTLVFLSFDEPISTNEAEFQMEVDLINTNPDYSRKADVVWLNSFSCYFMATENPPGPVTVRVSERGAHVGSKELRYQARQSELTASVIELLLRHIRLLCDELQRMGAAIDHLDRLLAAVFDSDDKNTQECLFVPYRHLNNNANGFVPGALELPTLLHLAAKYGFSELCSRLTDLPSVYYAYRLTNSSGWLPEDIAVQMGHDQLAWLLETFREVRDGLESVYVACRASQVNNGGDERYLPMQCFQRRKSSEDVRHLFEDEEDHDLYENNRDCLSIKTITERNETEQEVDEKRPVEHSFEKPNLQPIRSTEDAEESVVTSLSKSDESFLYSSSQKELLSLMYQVKNQVLTIAEAEVLFKEWKLRFNDKSASFKQKQAMLTKMRVELAHLQTHIKKGFFEKIVSRLKPTKTKSFESSYHSDDGISQDKHDDIYGDVPDELENAGIRSSTNKRATTFDSCDDESPLPSSSPHRPGLRGRSPGNSDSEQGGRDSEDDNDSYVSPDPRDDTSSLSESNDYSQVISLAKGISLPRQNASDLYDYPPRKRSLPLEFSHQTTNHYDYPRTRSSVQVFPNPAQNRCFSPDSADSPQNPSQSPEIKLRLPARPKPSHLVMPASEAIDQSERELGGESHYLSLFSSPTYELLPFERQAQVPAKAMTLNSAPKATVSTPRKWISSSQFVRTEAAEKSGAMSVELTMTPISPSTERPIRHLRQDILSSSLSSSSSTLATRNTTEEAKELCGSKVKREISRWREDSDELTEASCIYHVSSYRRVIAQATKMTLDRLDEV